MPDYLTKGMRKMLLKSFSRAMPRLAVTKFLVFGGAAFALMTSGSLAFADCTPGNCYGAIATALWNDSSGAAYVASGIGWNYDSANDASNAAIAQCQGYGGGSYCKVVGTFSNGGCGYVTTGTNASGVRWGIGGTAQDALDQCQQGGFTCKTPVGGCTAGAQ
jgi:hypothetical protein